MKYHMYLTWHGYAIARHEPKYGPTRHVATFHYTDKATAEAVCRDLNRSVARG